LYIVDSAGVDGRDPVQDLKILFDEIASYGVGSMIERPSLIVANKMDLIPKQSRRQELFYQLEKAAKDAGVICPSGIFPISAGVTGEGLVSLSKGIRDIVERGIHA
jgi:GTP-binding protein